MKSESMIKKSESMIKKSESMIQGNKKIKITTCTLAELDKLSGLDKKPKRACNACGKEYAYLLEENKKTCLDCLIYIQFAEEMKRMEE